MSGNNERVTRSRTKPISSSQPPPKRSTPTAGTRETLTQTKITRITPRPTENPEERDHQDANNARDDANNARNDASKNNLNNHQQHTTSAPTTSPNPTNVINEQGTNPNNTTDGNDGREAINANPNANPEANS